MSPEEKAEAIRQMQLTSGWALVTEYLKIKILDHRNQLMTCNLEDVTKNRGAVKALELFNLNINQMLNPEGE